jgi:hypothetical protein
VVCHLCCNVRLEQGICNRAAREKGEIALRHNTAFSPPVMDEGTSLRRHLQPSQRLEEFFWEELATDLNTTYSSRWARRKQQREEKEKDTFSKPAVSEGCRVSISQFEAVAAVAPSLHVWVGGVFLQAPPFSRGGGGGVLRASRVEHLMNHSRSSLINVKMGDDA